MNNKTTEHAFEMLQAIKAKVNNDVIKDYEMPSLCNIDTGKETGFAVILTLSTKYDYTNRVLDEWKQKFEAEDYYIKVCRNQLHVRFNVMFDKKKKKATPKPKPSHVEESSVYDGPEGVWDNR